MKRVAKERIARSAVGEVQEVEMSRTVGFLGRGE